MPIRTKSSVVALRLGVSQRQARRLIAAGDYRVEPVDMEWVREHGRKRERERLLAHRADIGLSRLRIQVILEDSKLAPEERERWRRFADTVKRALQRMMADDFEREDEDEEGGE